MEGEAIEGIKFEIYKVDELEGSILNLGERQWGVFSKGVEAVFASSLDTCVLVVLYDKREGEKSVGAVHYRSPRENEGVICGIYNWFQKRGISAEDVGVAIVRGRCCSENSENFLKISEELKIIGLSVPEDSQQGPNGLFLLDKKITEAVDDVPDWVRSRITDFYRQQVLQEVNKPA